jgi:hypothetical protein
VVVLDDFSNLMSCSAGAKHSMLKEVLVSFGAESAAMAVMMMCTLLEAEPKIGTAGAAF